MTKQLLSEKQTEMSPQSLYMCTCSGVLLCIISGSYFNLR